MGTWCSGGRGFWNTRDTGSRVLTFSAREAPGRSLSQETSQSLGTRPEFSGLVEVFEGLLRFRRSQDKQAFYSFFFFLFFLIAGVEIHSYAK